MSNRTTVRERALSLFDDSGESFSLSTIHRWLLISAGVMIFLVLPMLFVWSSLGMIHLQVSDENIHQSASHQNKEVSVTHDQLEMYRLS